MMNAMRESLIQEMVPAHLEVRPSAAFTVGVTTGTRFEPDPHMEAHEQLPQGGLSDEEKRRNVVRLVFAEDPRRFEEFCDVLRSGIPDNTGAVLRGSAVTGKRWDDDAPFDADGPGTSDLDLTLVGDEVIGLFKVTGFFVPGVHSRPLSDEDRDIAPGLTALREDLMSLVHRPVNIQATRDWVMYLRGHLLDQPYLTLIERGE
jgi:hypothetical protein